MKTLLKISASVAFALLLVGISYADAQAHRHGGRAHIGGSISIGTYYGPWYDPWYPYPPRGYYYYVPPDHGWLWTQVEPNSAEVWVDGRRYGLVSEFDGPVNHLRLPLGAHQARFTLPGYETYEAEFFIYPGDTTSINHDMVPLPAGAPPEPSREERGSESGYGTLLLDVSPGGAEIYVDGEYRATSNTEGDEMVVSVESGDRQITVSREGYMDYSTRAEVRPGGRVRISVRLKPR